MDGAPAGRSVARRLLRGAGAALLSAALLLAIAALVEHALEVRDERALAADQTFAQVGPARVRYRLLGDPNSGPVVVLMNGMVASLEEWDLVQARVAAFSPVLTYDGYGSGFSSGAAGYDAIAEADELAGLLDALGIRAPILLVGYSTAGTMARVFADRHRARLGALLLLNPYLPEIEGKVPGLHAPIRALALAQARSTLAALTGKFRFEIRGRKPLLPGGWQPWELRQRAVIVKLSHWIAADLRLASTAATARETMATRDFGALPLLVMDTEPSDTEELRVHAQLEAWLAHRSSRGAYRHPGAWGHDGALQEPGAEVLLDAIRELRAQIAPANR